MALFFSFFFNDTATTEIYTLSLHDALPILPERPFMFADDPSVKPGLHAPQTGPHEVVWWDPRTLRLAVEMDVGLRQQDILADTGSNESQERYKSWLARREETTLRGERKQFDIFTPSEAIDSPPGAETEVQAILTSRARGPMPEAPAVAGPRSGPLITTS